MTRDELEAAFPKDSLDYDAAVNLVALGYPTVAPVLEQILWYSLSDRPVAGVFREFAQLLTADALVEPLTSLLSSTMSNEEEDKYMLLSMYVRNNEALARKLIDVLKFLADKNSLFFERTNQEDNELHATSRSTSLTSLTSICAFEILVIFDLVDASWAKTVLKDKRGRIAMKQELIDEIGAHLQQTQDGLLARMPNDGNDVAKADELLALGFPALAGIVENILFASLEETPVASAYRSFLLSLGTEKLATILTHLLWRMAPSGHHDIYRILKTYVEGSETLAHGLHESSTLQILCLQSPDAYTRILALRILATYRLAERDWIANRLSSERGAPKDDPEMLAATQALAGMS